MKNAKKAEALLARRQHAWRLFCDGATFEAIGEQLSISNCTAWHDCVWWREEMARRGLIDEATRLQRQFDRSDRGYSRLSTIAASETTAPGDRIRAIAEQRGLMEHEAKLAGLYPQKEATYPVEQVINLLRTVTALFMEIVTDPALRQRFAEGLRYRRLGAALMDLPALGPEKGEE